MPPPPPTASPTKRETLSRRAALLAGAAGAASVETAAGAQAARATVRQGAAPPAGLRQPRALDGVPLDPAAGAGIGLGAFTAWIVPRAGLFGPGGDLSRLLREAMTLGEVVTCLEEVWVLESAPGAGGAIDLAAWAESEDGPVTMLAGTGRIADGGLLARLGTPAAARNPGDRAAAGMTETIEARLAVGADGAWTGDIDYHPPRYKTGPCYRRCHRHEGATARRCRRNCKQHEQRKRRRKRRR